MFIGHYAVGLASKEFAPRSSMGALIAAPILLDLLWPIFLLLGWEHVSIVPNNNPFLRLQFDSYPISHGLVVLDGRDLVARDEAEIALGEWHRLGRTLGQKSAVGTGFAPDTKGAALGAVQDAG